METTQGVNSPYQPISVGPDWLTATAKAGSPSLEFEVIADEALNEERAAGGAIHPAARYGFEGWRGDGFYFGRRHDDSIIVLSGPRTPALAARVAQAASNVSRLDLQVTVYCNGETPNLAQDGFDYLSRIPHTRGRRGQVQLITTKPKGDTLNVNSRSSDAFGRVYDKATEAKLGTPRTVWRYEVEFKRKMASHYASALVSSDDPTTLVSSAVHRWFERKRLPLSWHSLDAADLPPATIGRVSQPLLDWFRDSMSKTVARSINQYGLEATLTALGLTQYVQSKAGGLEHGSTHSKRSVPFNSGG